MEKANLTEEKLSGEKVFDGKLLHIEHWQVRLPDGSTALREISRHIGAVAVVPVDDDNCVTVVYQYRPAVGRVMLEIPAGKLDSADEDRLEAAQRELREETGATAAEWHALGLFCPVGAYSTERIQMYLARGLTFGERELDEDEFLNVFRMPLDELVDKVLAGEIPDAKTQAAALRAKMMLERGLI